MKTFQSIKIDEAKTLMENPDVTIADIRDPRSFQAGHIERAVLVSDGNVAQFIKEADKNKPLVCYCYHGISSQSAAEFFSAQGFREVYSLEGGFEKWKKVYPFAQSHG